VLPVDPFDSIPDTTAPVLSGVPASFSVNANTASGAVVTFKLPTATDPDDAAGPVTCAPLSGSVFPLGTTTVTCTSTDTHGNKGSASFTVTVVPLAQVVPVMLTETITVTDAVTPDLSALVMVTETITITDSPTPVVLDTTPPLIAGLPGSLTAEATGPAGAIVKFPAARRERSRRCGWTGDLRADVRDALSARDDDGDVHVD
jgi:HYR domain-containing protein